MFEIETKKLKQFLNNEIDAKKLDVILKI